MKKLDRKYAFALVIGVLCITMGFGGLFVENEIWYHDLLMTMNSIGVSIVCTVAYLAKKKGQSVSLVK